MPLILFSWWHMSKPAQEQACTRSCYVRERQIDRRGLWCPARGIFDPLPQHFEIHTSLKPAAIQYCPDWRKY